MKGWIQIFRTGTHTDSRGRTRQYTERDLDRIAKSYDPKKREAPIVVGHPASYAPAWGWVAALRRKGSVLEARFRQVAPAFRKAVQQGRYKKRSIALFPDGSLRHVGWLGGMPPAVEGMKDVKFRGKKKNHHLYTFEEENVDKLKKAEVRAEKAEAKAKKAEARAKKAEEQVRAYSASLSPKAGKKAKKRRVKAVKKLVRDGKITPAMSEHTLAFATALGVSQEEITLPGTVEACTVEEHFFNMLEGQPELSIFHVLDDSELEIDRGKASKDAALGDEIAGVKPEK